MSTSTNNMSKLISLWLCAPILGTLLSIPAVRSAEPISFTFTRVVDSHSPIPGGNGDFIFFTDPFTTFSLDGHPAVSIENGIIVFSGSGAAGQRGLYTAPVGGSITKIADTTTALPNGAGKFRLFGTPSISQGNVAFPASGEITPIAQGAFLFSRGAIKTVADQNTPVPGGIGIFRGIGRVLVDDANVAFEHSSVGKDRILVADKVGQLTLIADSTNFGVFNGLSFNAGVVAFIVGQRSIFAAPIGSPPVLVVDAGSLLSGETGFNPSIDNGVIAFLVQGNGIYLSTLEGSITPVVLNGSPIPGGAGNFAGFDADSPSHRDGIVAFRGFGSSGQEGIYASIGGSLTKVIDLTNPLDGKTLTHLFLGTEAVSRNQIVFAAQFADGSRGIYVAQVNGDCPNSDLSATVVIDGCDSEVPNVLLPSGCTISDLIGSCAKDARNHGQFVSCVSRLTNDLKKTGTIARGQEGAIQSCGAKAHIP